MQEPERNIINCKACGAAMDVTDVPPFSNVECPTCGAMERVKTEFGHYTLLRRLAEGGMSVVFIAMDNTLGRDVALKILNESYSLDEKRIAAFEEEARITASFSHPNVVRVFTTGRAFGRFFIAMELVPGGHFEHQIRERSKIPEAEILPFAIQVAEGLNAARSAGLIHRDIKPGNILIDAHGNAKIVDFGLALVTKGGSATAKEIWATPYYVPPETIEGHPEDFRSDLYAFGATLYHALAGKPPCDEESMATDRLRQAKQQVKPLKSVTSDITDATCLIVDKAMSYDRNDRYASYEEMISRLKSAQARLKKGITGQQPLTNHPNDHRREWLVIGGSALLVFIALVIGTIWITRKDSDTSDRHNSTITTSTQNIERPLNTENSIGRLYREARLALEKGHYENSFKAFSSLRNDPEVQEPTRSWTAVEAIISKYLSGDYSGAKTEADIARHHIQSADLPNQNSKDRILEALNQISELEPFNAPSSADHDASWALITMMGGLKNWEQGMVDLAANDFFKPLVRAEFQPKDQWLQIYQKIAKDYLHDHEMLNEPMFHSIPNEKAECLAAIKKCDQLLHQIKTQGRASFNLHTFRDELARQVRIIELQPKPTAKPSQEPIPEVPQSAEDPLLKYRELTSSSRFDDVPTALEKAPDELDKLSKTSLLTINDLSIKFLDFIEQEIQNHSQPIQLKLTSGGLISHVKINGKRHLKGTPPSGEEADYEWGDIDPESVIQFYRSTISRLTAESSEILLSRNEAAIAYDWLVGDRNRAKSAIEKLSTDNPLFKQRWAEIIKGLPE